MKLFIFANEINQETENMIETHTTMNLEHERKIADLQARVRSLENLCFTTKEVLNLEEAALFLGISRSMLYKLTHAGEIAFYKPAGKLIFFEKCHLLEWVRRGLHKSNADAETEAERMMRVLNKEA